MIAFVGLYNSMSSRSLPGFLPTPSFLLFPKSSKAITYENTFYGHVNYRIKKRELV